MFENLEKANQRNGQDCCSVIRINYYSEEVVAGDVPKNISKIVFMFLSLLHCALEIFVTEKRINSGGG